MHKEGTINVIQANGDIKELFIEKKMFELHFQTRSVTDTKKRQFLTVWQRHGQIKLFCQTQKLERETMKEYYSPKGPGKFKIKSDILPQSLFALNFVKNLVTTFI
jgi:hypothetical protein